MESVTGKGRVQLDGYRGCFIAAIGVKHAGRADSGSQQEHQPINHTANALARQAKHVCYLVCTEAFSPSSGKRSLMYLARARSAGFTPTFSVNGQYTRLNCMLLRRVRLD